MPENTAGCPADEDTSGTLPMYSAPLTIVRGVACAGSEMLQNICVAPSTSTAPQYWPVASENSVTVEFSVTGASGSTAFVMVKAAAALLTVVEPVVVLGGGEGAGSTPGGNGGGGGASALATLAVLTVVSTPLTTARVVPVGEVKEVWEPELSDNGGLGGLGGGGRGGGGGGLGAAQGRSHSFWHLASCPRQS